MRAASKGVLAHLARLYWYTVEFGLIRSGDALKIYGAGIVSSYGESFFALDDPSPNRLGFDLTRVMRTNYKIDDYQQSYFVIDSFEKLLADTLETDFEPIYRAMANQDDLAPGALLPSDVLFTHGTQEYARRKEAAQ